MTTIISRIKVGFVTILLLIAGINGSSQNCPIRVSLLTASPGDELYSTFGHSALRIYDSTNHRDLVFNYGTFNFDEPNFYLKFVRGKLEYFISVDDFQSFEYEYQVENRSLTEQVLNLTCGEKEKLKEYLQWNLLPQNRFYKYDFTFDNCTTRLLLLVDSITGDSVQYKPIISGHVSFRNAIHEYLNLNQKSWSKLGIDILLGSRLDRGMTNKEAMFLPDNLMEGLDSASIGSRPLVADKEVIVKHHYVPTGNDNISGPMFIFSCLFVIIAFLSFSNNNKIKRILKSLDASLLFINGLIGVLLVFMWLGTDHFMTKDNLNLLWAWPINAIAAFYVHNPRKWSRIYLLIYALAQILLLIFWFFLPQHLNISLIPIVLIFIVRCFLNSSAKTMPYAKDQLSK